MAAVLWCSCLLGLLFTPAGANLQPWTASQSPSDTFVRSVNSSAEITCTTSLPDPMGVYLRRYFHGDSSVIFLALKRGKVTTSTRALEFEGRIDVTPHVQSGRGCGFTLHLSMLQVDDTDMFYCRWTYYNSRSEALESNGTVIIVREKAAEEQCGGDQTLDVILVILSATAFSAVLLMLVGALVMRCKRFKKRFKPARSVTTSRRHRQHHACPQHRVQVYPYYTTTSAQTCDFRGIL